MLDKLYFKVLSFILSSGLILSGEYTKKKSLDKTINNLTNIVENTSASKSHIKDANFAAETSKLTKAQILNQAATSMLAQANASKQTVLALLQN